MNSITETRIKRAIYDEDYDIALNLLLEVVKEQQGAINRLKELIKENN